MIAAGLAATLVLTSCNGDHKNNSGPSIHGVWRLIQTSHTPSRGSGAQLIYDAARQRMLLVGWSTDRVWEWSGSDWRSVDTVGGTRTETHLTAAYDASRGRVVVFDGKAFLELDGDQWNRLQPAPSPPREASALAYDPVRHALLLSGGYTGTGQRSGDTTSLHEVWQLQQDRSAHDRLFQLPIEGGPRARSMHALVTGPDRVFLIGGRSEGWVLETYLSDVWIWDGKAWSGAPALPVGLAAFGASFDTERNRLVVFGGTGRSVTIVVYGETLEFDGQQWLQVASSARPSPRLGSAMAYDPRHKNVVLYGGESSEGYQNDTWIYEGPPPQVLRGDQRE